ncbi:MAG: carbamoyltransferase HypF [Magnetococcales bacterium]|nr:carbamoyltransferase HypF [Magnetococcales bacterium]
MKNGPLPWQWTMEISGVVQGIGFRPALHRLATAAGLGGWVENRSDGVRLALIGPPEALTAFLEALPFRLPALARIDRIEITDRAALDPSSAPLPFHIRSSSGSPAGRISIPPDLAVCPACIAEIMDPANRRYGYPFTSCTECGPRYTVLERLPYDRENTSLRLFPLCPDCLAEYGAPLDRRFHAESMACPRCGPRLFLTDRHGREQPGDPLRSARQALAQGRILAVRGLGGFQLLADAANRAAIETLRQRKSRPHKPLALMAASVEVLAGVCHVSEPEWRLLRHPGQPIVILDRRAGPAAYPMEIIAPDSATLGVMLPTTPLHHLLLHPLAGDPVAACDFLIATSGNPSGEPLCIGNDEARERLGAVADLFLCHDREIIRRNDDSVTVCREGAVQAWRRARGMVPESLRPPRPLRRNVLAMGADLKNTFTLGFEDRLLPSPHIGDLRSARCVDELEETLRSLLRLLGGRVEVVAVDLHPDMQSTRLGRRLAEAFGVPLASVQHHHAHALACMAEHGVSEGMALVWDGVGLGTDGGIWGAELLHVTARGAERLASFESVPLPGGDQAVLRPARQLIARLADAGIDWDPAWLAGRGIDPGEAEIWREQTRRGLNAPPCHAAGRLFDAYAALLGLAPERISYEGQAAVRLESAARLWGGEAMTVPFGWRTRADGLGLISWREAFGWAMARLEEGQPVAMLARALHRGVAEAALAMARHGAALTGERRIFLSGGVFMNRLLCELLLPRLEGAGLLPLAHGRIPPNDNGISLGQAVAAASLG